MNYNFNLGIAAEYGLAESVFLQNIAYWVLQNKSNNIHFYENRYWTYNTQKAFTQLFPFWTRQNLRRVIDSCKKHGLIITGNFNKIVYDRTNWYTLSDKGLSLFSILNDRNLVNNNQNLGDNQPGQWLESTKTMVANNPPIPLINTDNKPYIKDKITAQPKKQVAVVSDAYVDPYVLKPEIVLPDWLPNEVWEEFKQHRKQLKKPMSELAQKKSIKQLEKWRSEGQDVVEVIEASIANGWQGLFEIKSQGEAHGKGNSNLGTGRKEKFDSTQWLLDRAKARARGEDPDAIESHVPVENIQYLWNT